MYEVYDEKTKLYMVMELMTGGELFDRIVEKESYNEKEAADVIRPIVDTIRCFIIFLPRFVFRLSFYGHCA
jgi:calcium/calmodulin-dependent protein kinase I